MIAIVAQHRRHHAGTAVGRRRHDAPAGGVLLVHCDRVDADVVHHGVRCLSVALPIGRETLVQAVRAALHFEAAEQHAFSAHAAIDAREHGSSDALDVRVDLGTLPQPELVGEHDFCDSMVMLAAHYKQFCG